MKKIVGKVNLLDENIKEKLTTENIYKIFNNFIIPLITKEEQEFLENLEEFLLNQVEPEIDLNKDVYELFKILELCTG